MQGDALPILGLAHPRSVATMGRGTEASGIWADVGPFGSDRGADSLLSYPQWRTIFPRTSLVSFLRQTLKDQGAAELGPQHLETETIRQQLEDKEFDFHQGVYVVDETLLATALAQLYFEGGIDDAALPLARLALERQRHPLVLARIFPDNTEERRLALAETARWLDGAGPVPPHGRRRLNTQLRNIAKAEAEERKAAEALITSPWSVNSVLSHRLPSGTRLLLHHFRMAEYHFDNHKKLLPAFYVLDWRADALPSEVELATLKPADDWSFVLLLPGAKSPSDVPAHNQSLLEALAPTGLVLSGERFARKPIISRVDWKRLDEYLIHNYDA